MHSIGQTIKWTRVVHLQQFLAYLLPRA